MNHSRLRTLRLFNVFVYFFAFTLHTFFGALALSKRGQSTVLQHTSMPLAADARPRQNLLLTHQTPIFLFTILCHILMGIAFFEGVLVLIISHLDLASERISDFSLSAFRGVISRDHKTTNRTRKRVQRLQSLATLVRFSGEGGYEYHDGRSMLEIEMKGHMGITI